MKIFYECDRFGNYEIGNSEDERTVYIQDDFSRLGLASRFGWVPCKCGETDGTVDCRHKTVMDMINSATSYLDNHQGEEIDDPGYFEEED